MAKKPGVMIYFETGQAIKGLDYETKGRLFEAIMEYAEFGTVPPMDGVLSAVWPFIASKIDRDAQSYEKTVKGRKRAIYRRWWLKYAAANGLDPNDDAAADAWIAQQMEKDTNVSGSIQADTKDTNVSGVIQTIPTTTGTTTTTGTVTGAGTTGAEPARAYGSFGPYNNVYLTEEEYNGLLRSIPRVEAVIDKLSEYMKSTGKHYDSHEATIRKWAREDAEKQAQQTTQARRNSGNVFRDLVEGGAV